MSEIKQIAPDEWDKFLREFSERNKNRRARFQIFRGQTVENDDEEAHLAEVSIKSETNSNTVVVTRVYNAQQNGGEKIEDSITNVVGIAVQYDTDGSENVLEITDRENELISLRMESLVDGAS